MLMSCMYTKAQVVITSEDEKRAEDLVRQMTLDEKIGMIAGERSFYLRGVERLGIPAIRIADGPQGVRNNTKSTLYPCGILTAATWNRGSSGGTSKTAPNSSTPTAKAPSR